MAKDAEDAKDTKDTKDTKNTKDTDKPFRKQERRSSAVIDDFRETAAKAVRIVFIVFAVVLAVGAFLVSVRNNVSSDNALVKFVWDVADAIDGPFSRDNGIFKFDGKNAETKDAVVNWGIAAIVYLVIGNVIQRLLRPAARPVVKR